MAGKKPDFTGINTGRAIHALETATARSGQQGKATPQEAKERAAKLKTQGRKGCKATRINMAFTPENHEYIKVMARLTGKTMTEYTNLCIEQHRQQHPELYEQAKVIIAGLAPAADEDESQ